MLLTGYLAGAERRYEALNGVAGEILAGGSAGQTFIARYDRLSSVDMRIGTYGRQSDPTRAPLVMHLRSSPTSSKDFATVTLDPSTLLIENGWYRFAFTPIEHSAGKQYYIEIDSPDATPENGLTLYWFKPNPLGDPYPAGNAYVNGEPVKADLTFGMGYSAPPIEVWGGMLGAAAAKSSGIVIALLLLASVAGSLFAALMLPAIMRDPTRRRRWILRWGLFVALAAALVNGLLYLLVVPPWQGPDEYAHFAYVALLDRHGLDDQKIKTLDLLGRDRDTELIEAVNASADRHGFTRFVAGASSTGGPTNTGPYLFQQTRQPATYYWLCALGLKLARSLGAPADPYGNPEAALMVMRLVSLMLSLIVVGLAWLCGRLLSPAGGSWLQLLLPLTVGLLPMHAFISTIVNNDILAEVAVSALFTSVVALARWPGGVRGISLASLSTLIALASVATKSTAVAASVPLLVGGLALWAWLLLTHKTAQQQLAPVQTANLRPFMKRMALVISALLLVLVGTVLLAYQQDESRSAGWFASYDPIERVGRVQTTTAHEGTHVVQLGGAFKQTAVQNLVPPLYHPSLIVSFSGWTRLAPGQTTHNTQATIAVLERDRVAGSGVALLDPSGAWVRLEIEGRVSAGAEPVWLQLAAVGAPATVQFDDMSLDVRGINQEWRDPVFTPVLLDPSAEKPPIVLREFVAGALPSDVRSMADALANGQVFSKVAIWRDYAYAQYRSFWGSFGWLTVNLPEPFFTLLALLSLSAVVGLILALVRSRRSATARLGLVSMSALVVAIFAGFAKQTMLTAYGGLPSAPQGRYLFVLIIPVAWLLLAGLHEVWRKGQRLLPANRLSGREIQTDNIDRKALLNPCLVWVAAFIFFTAYSLLSLILPFYDG